MHFTEADEQRLALKSGDLLTCEGGDIGRTAIWRGELMHCYYQNHLHRARLKRESEADSRFVLHWLWYAFKTAHVYFGRGNVTTIPNLSQSKLCELPLPVPPLAEQKKIAAVLGLVQRSIVEQERLLALTTELKKTLLHKLFTEGLRSEPQKQTKIGPVPESWEVSKIGDVFHTQLGKMLSQKSRVGRALKPYLRNKNVQWGRIDVADLLEMDFNERELSKHRLLPGDLLVCEGGEPGRAALWNGEIGECYYQKALHRLRPKDKRVTNPFLAHWLMFSLKRQKLYDVAGASSTIAHLPEVQLKVLPIPQPTRSEQDQICIILETADRKLGVIQKKYAMLTVLFQTLLHQLMMAKIRVNHIEIELENLNNGSSKP